MTEEVEKEKCNWLISKVWRSCRVMFEHKMVTRIRGENTDWYTKYIF